MRPPKIVTLTMTNGCNLECSHCWPESRSVQSVHPVSAQTLKRLIHELADMHAEEICLTGGEPLSHPDWHDILSCACGHPEFKRVMLQTNATLIDDITIQKLGAIQHRGLVVQVSLEGAGSTTHDQVRGQGSFDAAFRGLRLLSEGGLG